MPYCSKCDQPYDDQWDGCPRCSKAEARTLQRIASGVSTLVVFGVLSFLGALFLEIVR